MKKFDPKQYYIREKETIYGKVIGSRIELKPAGIKLVQDHYLEKYNTSIAYEFGIESVADKIKTLREKNELPVSYRKGFIVAETIFDPQHHSLAIIYLKEGNEEIILLIDSQGSSSDKKNYQHQWAKELYEQTGISTYAVKNSFQSDNYSCHAVAVSMTKDCTAKTGKNEYQLANLLHIIKGRSEAPKEGFAWGKLPDELLKIFHLSREVEYHTEHSEKIVGHKRQETLTTFRERFTIRPTSRIDIKFNDYLRKKGLRFSDITAIQFYLGELATELQELPTELQNQWPGLKNEFRKEAKKILSKTISDEKKQEQLYDYAAAFIEKKFNNNKQYQEFIANQTIETIGLKLTKAISEGDLPQVKKYCTMTTANKPSAETVSRLFNEAVKNKQWGIISILCTMTTDNQPSQNDISKTLIEAYNNFEYSVVQTLCAMKTVNKPGKEVIIDTLNSAVELYTTNLPTVRCICAMITDNKPNHKAIAAALKEAQSNKLEDIVPLLMQAEKISTLYEHINQLKTHGEQLTAPDKEQTVLVAEELKRLTDSYVTAFFAESSNVNEIQQIKQKFTTYLKESYDKMDNHRNILGPIFKNIAVAATGVGLLVVIGKILASGKGFFWDTKRQSHLNKIQDDLKNIPDSTPP